MMIIIFTVIGSIFTVFIGKRDHKRGVGYTDDLIKQHSEYSPAYQQISKIAAQKD